jgi:serine/threonine-protein kinase RsbW
MADVPPNVRLNLSSTAENVVLTREMLSGVAEAIDLDRGDLDDIRTAVTEACNNVVLHAYSGEQGPLEVDLCIGMDSLTILVRDRGRGINTPSDIEDATSPGIGLHVIRTLAHTVEFKHIPDGGTEVRMEFVTPRTKSLEPAPDEDLTALPLALTDPPITTMLSITPIGLARTVLPRLVSALAARAHFSTDRISDAQLLTDALVAHAHRAVSGDHLSIGVNVEPRDLELHIAPLGLGRAQRLLGDSKIDGLGRVIEKLTDRHDVASAGPYETLTLGLIDRR